MWFVAKRHLQRGTVIYIYICIHIHILHTHIYIYMFCTNKNTTSLVINNASLLGLDSSVPWGGPREVHAAAAENRREDLGAQEVRGQGWQVHQIGGSSQKNDSYVATLGHLCIYIYMFICFTKKTVYLYFCLFFFIFREMAPIVGHNL